MKRHGKLWGQIVDLDNIKAAHNAARRGKAYYTEVKMVDADVDRYAKEIQSMLVNKTFRTSEYQIEQRSDGRKIRTIHKLPYYPDRIVQHALLNIIGPILTASFIRDSFQSIVGRGTSDAMRRVRSLVSEQKPKFALKVDVEKYYPSIDNCILKQEIRRKIKCADTLWLIDDIVDSAVGLPIGNYTSQHFGNLYLNRFDWWMKQKVKPVGYFRYCDDIVVAGNSRHDLVKLRQEISSKLHGLGLKVKPTWFIYNVAAQGIDFVGYVFRHQTTRLRASIADKFKSACKRIKSPTDSNRSKIMAYKGWCRSVNAKMLWRRNTRPLSSLFSKQLRHGI